MATLLKLRFNIEAPISFSGFTSMPSGYLKVPEKNERLAIRSPGVGRRRSRRIPVRWRSGLGKGGGGRPRGSPNGRFDGLEGALEGLAGQLRGARRWPPRRREIPARPGRIWAMRGRGGFHRVPGRCGGSWTTTEGKGGRAHRAALMVAGGGMKQRGEKVGASRKEQRAASPLWSTCARARLPQVTPP
jgi:hypothetical protein